MVDLNELKTIELFRALSNKYLQELTRITNRRQYRTNALIYEQGQPATELFIVRKGLVSLRSLESKNNVAIVFEQCEPGDIFGAASLMKARTYTLTAVCLEATELLAIDADKLLMLCEHYFELGYRLMTKVAQLYFDRYEVASVQLGIPVPAPRAATR